MRGGAQLQVVGDLQCAGMLSSNSVLIQCLHVSNENDVIHSCIQLGQVEEYMRYRKLPQSIRQRVQEFYEYRYRKKFFNEEAILKELSLGLREVST